MLDLTTGTRLVKLARSTVEQYFKNGKFVLEKIKDQRLNEKNGIFVTIENFPDNSLRGCIGFSSTDMPLWESVQKATCSAAFQDPRFQPLEQEELDKVTFEVSVMTKPELIEVKNTKEYLKKIEIGKDGLILQNGPFSALFLPQVWDIIPTTEKFLESLCLKAGLIKDSWQDRNTEIWKFRVHAFKETRPKGKIVEE